MLLGTAISLLEARSKRIGCLQEMRALVIIQASLRYLSFMIGLQVYPSRNVTVQRTSPLLWFDPISCACAHMACPGLYLTAARRIVNES